MKKFFLIFIFCLGCLFDVCLGQEIIVCHEQMVNFLKNYCDLDVDARWKEEIVPEIKKMCRRGVAVNQCPKELFKRLEDLRADLYNFVLAYKNKKVLASELGATLIEKINLCDPAFFNRIKSKQEAFKRALKKNEDSEHYYEDNTHSLLAVNLLGVLVYTLVPFFSSRRLFERFKKAKKKSPYGHVEKMPQLNVCFEVSAGKIKISSITD
ncbi:MAG: hypothetical protein ABH827_01885 [bacterium]